MSTQSVKTAIQVIETISLHQPIGLSDIAKRTGGSKATVLRMLATLKEMNWVQQSDTRDAAWSLSFHTYAVTARAGLGVDLRDIAIGPMNGLQLDTRETVHLCVPDGKSLVVIERLDTPHVLRAFLALGTPIPLHASATGLAFLGASADEFVRDVLAGPLEGVSEQTVTDPESVWKLVRETRERGYAINEEGLSSGITSLGAPIVNSAGVPVGSVSISGPSSRIEPAKYEEYGTAVVRTAGEISALLRGSR
ncbi:IclR family transcriptional regulator [Paeniglutamicibacter sp. ZC-3]|uniref:IclR family transcriptional regulator n=1 Tax=Paeniglutamicibacter sp. ZC-3 TaxID=2986919 RepID=UPI0021F717AB|nr:IclR family transcriptional regulator [Paeniglutamicibacter sp. ZC-3]MCV9993531.1 IclR family transcriptional regulator [Paeniglutamicibacter sp. ZC-3]